MFSNSIKSMAILLVVVLFYLADFLLTRQFDKLRGDDRTGRSWSYTIFGILAGLLVIVQPVILPQLSLHIGAAWGQVMQMAGLVLCGLALVLNWWARTHLRHFYTEGADFQKGHRVIRSGPYAYVRHPIFVSFFLLVLGLLLINPAVTTALIAVYTFVDFSHAARRDEKLLAEKLPEYADYMKQTPRFFPRLW